MDKFDILYAEWLADNLKDIPAEDLLSGRYMKSAFLDGMQAGMKLLSAEQEKAKQEWWQQENDDEDWIETQTGN